MSSQSQHCPALPCTALHCPALQLPRLFRGPQSQRHFQLGRETGRQLEVEAGLGSRATGKRGRTLFHPAVGSGLLEPVHLRSRVIARLRLPAKLPVCGMLKTQLQGSTRFCCVAAGVATSLAMETFQNCGTVPNCVHKAHLLRVSQSQRILLGGGCRRPSSLLHMSVEPTSWCALISTDSRSKDLHV